MSDTMSSKEMLQVRLNGLKQNHGDLDLAIEALNKINTSDQLSVRRLKKEKLKVKKYLIFLMIIITLIL